MGARRWAMSLGSKRKQRWQSQAGDRRDGKVGEWGGVDDGGWPCNEGHEVGLEQQAWGPVEGMPWRTTEAQDNGLERVVEDASDKTGVVDEELGATGGC